MTTLVRLGRTAVAAVLGCGALLAAAPGPAAAAPPPAVAYTMTTNWGTGFQVQLTITPGTAVTSWSVEFDAADQQVATFAAYAAMTQVGRHLTVSNRSFNGTVAAGGSVSVLLQFTNPTLNNVPPAGFTVNGQQASYSPQPYLLASVDHPAVPEGGSGAFTVVLSQPPTADVRVQVGGGGTPAVTASPQWLTFTAANWSVPQTVTLASAEDTDSISQTVFVPLQQWTGSPFYASDVVMATQVDRDARGVAGGFAA